MSDKRVEWESHGRYIRDSCARLGKLGGGVVIGFKDTEDGYLEIHLTGRTKLKNKDEFKRVASELIERMREYCEREWGGQ